MNTAEWPQRSHDGAGLGIALQWSRRVNTAECVPAGLIGLEDDEASMEPPCELGGVSSSANAFGRSIVLQWSRRVNTAECPNADGTSTPYAQLQWSRRVNTAECCRGALRPRLHSAPASMEPPCEHGGVISLFNLLARIAGRFNGAAV